MKFEYDPHAKIGYYKCPECDVTVPHSAVVEFKHTQDCSQKGTGIDNTTYFVSPLEIMCLNKFGSPVYGRVNKEILSGLPEDAQNLTFSGSTQSQR